MIPERGKPFDFNFVVFEVLVVNFFWSSTWIPDRVPETSLVELFSSFACLPCVPRVYRGALAEGSYFEKVFTTELTKNTERGKPLLQ